MALTKSGEDNIYVRQLFCFQAYADYYTMMDLSEELIRACSDAVNGKQKIEYQGESLDFSQPFRRATMHDLVEQATGRILVSQN